MIAGSPGSPTDHQSGLGSALANDRLPPPESDRLIRPGSVQPARRGKARWARPVPASLAELPHPGVDQVRRPQQEEAQPAPQSERYSLAPESTAQPQVVRPRASNR